MEDKQPLQTYVGTTNLFMSNSSVQPVVKLNEYWLHLFISVNFKLSFSILPLGPGIQNDLKISHSLYVTTSCWTTTLLVLIFFFLITSLKWNNVSFLVESVKNLSRESILVLEHSEGCLRVRLVNYRLTVWKKGCAKGGIRK